MRKLTKRSKAERTEPSLGRERSKCLSKIKLSKSTIHKNKAVASDSGSILGSLRRHVKFWERIGASETVLTIIREGYCLPFREQPPKVLFNNNQSAMKHSEFVTKEIESHLKTGFCQRVREPPHCINPLTVADNGEKLRLVLDCSRSVNVFLKESKFKIEDIRVLIPYLRAGGFLIKFDLKKGYFHVDIREDHWKYLGFQWQGEFFVFTVLVFGLSSGPYVFTKLMRCVVKYWRAQGIPIVIYLDDGVAVLPSKLACQKVSTVLQRDLGEAGLVTQVAKCVWVPQQVLEWTGIIIDLDEYQLSIPQRRMTACLAAISRILEAKGVTTARRLSSCVGQIISMSVVLGSLSQLQTRYCSFEVVIRSGWDREIRVSRQALAELSFWRSNLQLINQKDLAPDSRELTLVFSDASKSGGGAFVTFGGEELVAVNQWSEAERETSSTYRELAAVWFALRSFGPKLKGKCLQWNTDNKGVASIIPKGSMKPYLHEIAIKIFEFCLSHKISLRTEWIPRGENERADQLSRISDFDDWRVNDWFFREIEKEVGCEFSVDRFADHKNAKCERFFSQYWVPRTEGVNAFSALWGGEQNWLVPPVHLISKTIDHIALSNCDGVLVAPAWKSASFWPKLFPAQSQRGENLLRVFTVDGRGVFERGTQKLSVFGPDFKGEVLVAQFQQI